MGKAVRSPTREGTRRSFRLAFTAAGCLLGWLSLATSAPGLGDRSDHSIGPDPSFAAASTSPSGTDSADVGEPKGPPAPLGFDKNRVDSTRVPTLSNVLRTASSARVTTAPRAIVALHSELEKTSPSSVVAASVTAENPPLPELRPRALDRLGIAGAFEEEAPDAPSEREWRLVMGRHWQIAGPTGEDPAVTDAAEGNRGSCPVGMVYVAGRMKIAPLMDELQLQSCTNFISRQWPERCAEFDREQWLALSKDLPTRPMNFCMDRFEYPNRKGAEPIIMVNWHEANALCATQGKRMCTETEWTFACEGEEAQPYPYGYARDTDACVIDKAWRPFHENALTPRDGVEAKQELDRLWQGEASGARPRCKSPSGVYDLTGNVDEWTRSSVPGERPSILKGGYWGPVRNRCRPSTRAHGENHTFYQQGVRCCADAGS